MHYYLVASLPPIAIGDTAPWSPAEFLFHCQGALDADEWRELALITEDRAAEGDSNFAQWWTGLETQIRNTAARIRAARLNVDVRAYVRMHSGFDVSVEQAVTDALSHGTPLERELTLARARWKALDERVVNRPFHFETVLAYAIRLRLLDRWTRLDETQGLERIETFITENADKSLELQRLGGA